MVSNYQIKVKGKRAIISSQNLLFLFIFYLFCTKNAEMGAINSRNNIGRQAKLRENIRAGVFSEVKIKTVAFWFMKPCKKQVASGTNTFDLYVGGTQLESLLGHQ
jgi:hypothetical protein